MDIEVYIDGLCQPRNPKGIACYAFLVKQNANTMYAEGGLAAEPFSENATNNAAEYTALIKVLEWLIKNGRQQSTVRIKSDSQLLVKQMQGDYRVRDGRILPLFKRALLLSRQITACYFDWIPRTQNREADALTNKAYNEAIIKNPRLLDEL